MARNMQPIAKRCKALNLSPAAMGYAKKTTNRNPKGMKRCATLRNVLGQIYEKIS